jgi:hypothetical protein
VVVRGQEGWRGGPSAHQIAGRKRKGLKMLPLNRECQDREGGGNTGLSWCESKWHQLGHYSREILEPGYLLGQLVAMEEVYKAYI